MKPIKPPVEQDDLLRSRLVEMIDMRHELVKLAALIDWDVFEREWALFFPSHMSTAEQFQASGAVQKQAMAGGGMLT